MARKRENYLLDVHSIHNAQQIGSKGSGSGNSNVVSADGAIARAVC